MKEYQPSLSSAERRKQQQLEDLKMKRQKRNQRKEATLSSKIKESPTEEQKKAFLEKLTTVKA